MYYDHLSLGDCCRHTLSYLGGSGQSSWPSPLFLPPLVEPFLFYVKVSAQEWVRPPLHFFFFLGPLFERAMYKSIRTCLPVIHCKYLRTIFFLAKPWLMLHSKGVPPPLFFSLVERFSTVSFFFYFALLLPERGLCGSPPQWPGQHPS